MIDLPVRNGVGASYVALPPGPWHYLVDYLASRFPAIPYAQWVIRMAHGDVLDTSGHALGSDSIYRPHQKIAYYRSLPVEPRIPFTERILFQDDFIIAVDKPHFLPVTPAGNYLQETLLVRLKRSLGIKTLAPMHRIDRDTAGIVLFTIQPSTRNLYQALFSERKVLKIYEAVAARSVALQFPLHHCSRLEQSAIFMQMKEVPGLSNTQTRIEVITTRQELAKYRLYPITGHKHQLRVHMSSLGIPIVNDRIYPLLQPAPLTEAQPDYSSPLQLLAKTIRFLDPVTAQVRQFDSMRTLIV